MYTHRLQLETANELARRFANATADELVEDLRRVVWNATTALDDLLAEGFEPGWISDAAGSLLDDAADKLTRINRDLDAAGCWSDRTLWLGELRDLHARATAKWQDRQKGVA
jgi:hypothetical protein